MVKIMEHPIKMDDLGVQQFSETPKYIKSIEHASKRIKMLKLKLFTHLRKSANPVPKPKVLKVNYNATIDYNRKLCTTKLTQIWEFFGPATSQETNMKIDSIRFAVDVFYCSIPSHQVRISSINSKIPSHQDCLRRSCALEHREASLGNACQCLSWGSGRILILLEHF